MSFQFLQDFDTEDLLLPPPLDPQDETISDNLDFIRGRVYGDFSQSSSFGNGFANKPNEGINTSSTSNFWQPPQQFGTNLSTSNVLPPSHTSVASYGLPSDIFRSLNSLSSSQPNPPSNVPSHMSNIFSTSTILSTSNPETLYEDPSYNDPTLRQFNDNSISSYGSELGDPRRIGSHESENEFYYEDPGSSPIRSPTDYSIHHDSGNPHEHPLGEHPSRTLFVRNINSNVEDEELKKLFEQYGPIRNMYTHCKHRGFVMISYFDIRNAKNAMRQLQGKPLRRRKLDIHYSIPKENPPEKDQNQGTLVVFNLDSSTTNEELKEIFGKHGEIKEIRETPNKKYHKFIEFYDVRDADKAMKCLNKTEICGKKIKIEISRPGGRPKILNSTSITSPTSPGSAPSSALARVPSLDLDDEPIQAHSLPDFHFSPTGPSSSSNSFSSSKYPNTNSVISSTHNTLNNFNTSFNSSQLSQQSHLNTNISPFPLMQNPKPLPQSSSNSFSSSSNSNLMPHPISPPPSSSLFASDFSLFPNNSTGSHSNSFIPGLMNPVIGVPRSTSPSGREIHKNRATDEDKIRFALNIGRVKSGQDNRTTLMIKNIPNKYSQKMLLASVDAKFKGLYDFFYLPIDFKNKCNVGYAFINFIQPEYIIGFYEDLNNKKWEKFNSDKVCEITYARIQGKHNLIQHFQNSSLMSEDKKCRPIIFHSDGPFIGEQEPFPIGPKVKNRVSSKEDSEP